MIKPILDENSDISEIDFDNYCLYTDNILTEAFIEKYQDKLELYIIIECQKLSENFIEKFQNYLENDPRFYLSYWERISFWQDLSEEFIIKHQDEVSWAEISQTQKLSNKFIAKYIDKLDTKGFKYNFKIDQNFVEKINLLK